MCPDRAVVLEGRYLWLSFETFSEIGKQIMWNLFKKIYISKGPESFKTQFQ